MQLAASPTKMADEIIEYISSNGLTVEWIIETHVHADHLSAAPYLQEKLGGKIGISSNIMTVQETFGKVFNEGTDFQRDGSQFDALFSDGRHLSNWQHGISRTGHTGTHAGLYGSRDRRCRICW